MDHNKLWKILQEKGILDHITCFLRNMYAGQEATVRTGHATTDCFQTGKGVRQGCTLSPCLFNFCAEWSEVKLLSRVRLFATLWTVAYQTPPFTEFSRQEYWSGLPFPSPADLPEPGIEPRSPALQADALPSEPPGESTFCKMPGWMKHKLESRLLGEISITLDMQMTPPLRQKVKKN